MGFALDISMGKRDRQSRFDIPVEKVSCVDCRDENGTMKWVGWTEPRSAFEPMVQLVYLTMACAQTKADPRRGAKPLVTDTPP